MSNYWRKIGLGLVSLLLTTSCIVQGDRKITNQQPQPLQGEILVWAEMPFQLTEAQSIKYQKLLQNDIEEFSQLYPQIQVLLEFFPSGQSWEPFELQVKRGAGPDLLLSSSTIKTLKLIKIGALRALEESEVEESRFRSEGLKPLRYQGKLYGLPMSFRTKVLCYNKNHVKELPRNLAELIEQARDGYSVGVHSGFSETFWGIGVFGSQLFDARGRVILAEEGVWAKGWAKWMKWLKKAQNEPNFILSKNPEVLQQAFVEGKITYLICPSDWILYFSEALGKDKLGATLLPGETNQPASPILWTAILLFNQASSPNQTRLALKLADFLTNVEQQTQAEIEVPIIPSNKNVTLNRELFPIRATLLDQAQSGIAFPLDDAEKLKAIKDYGDIFYLKVLAGEITPDEAAAQLTQIINRQFGSE